MGRSGDWEQRVQGLWAMFDDIDEADFLARMTVLATERPSNDPDALFELASAYDSVGQEAMAEPTYRRALAGGLADGKRRRAAIQLASTLRNLGRAEESVAILKAECDHASDTLDDAVSAFLALALADVGREREALSIALAALAPHLPRYARSLTSYAANLGRFDSAGNAAA